MGSALRRAIPLAACAAVAALLSSSLLANIGPGLSRPCEYDLELPWLGQESYVTDVAEMVDGHVVISGRTFDKRFPTTADALDRTCGTALPCTSYRTDGFVSVVSWSGELVYSTYLGDDAEEDDVLVAPAGDSVWAVPTHAMDYESRRDGARCNGSQPMLVRVVPGEFGTQDHICVGGRRAWTVVTDIAAADDGSVWVVGFGKELETVNAWQPVSTGAEDIFVAHYAPGASRPTTLTLVGGSDSEWAGALALAPDGDPVFLGSTGSRDFPLVRPYHTWDGTTDWSPDTVLVRLDSSGRWVDYSTYVGAHAWDPARGLALDREGNAYVAGATDSVSLPTTPGTLTSGRGDIDLYVVGVDGVGALRFAAIVGSSAYDAALRVFALHDRSLLLQAFTSSWELPRSLGVSPLLSGDFFMQLSPQATAFVSWSWFAGIPGRRASLEAMTFDGYAHMLVVSAGDGAIAWSGGWVNRSGPPHLTRWHVDDNVDAFRTH